LSQYFEITNVKSNGCTKLLGGTWDGGRVHDKPIADATPYPLPAGSRLWQALGFLACTLPQVEILRPTKKGFLQNMCDNSQQRRTCFLTG